ncbi:MAG: heme ABC exporter ATP-binding protein CcmA [Thermoflexales bacterium]|nr:heme ABC exporter ATP-binding protein CcmA [Thermoflexales bacterium]MCS7325529.1 heme ABC exporter ATP-binding protein CcmA [Thermoflexales bacterium]MCX7940061.1 heme ABC exporter ATP-binding protein CcmA [Thermoflexales bacterium]MDW8053971.1 heme ABC exporter ATP-binding protein CcmA [Anaerolineae bacterium]MDW8293093.1 heme ABC exporter ATP-binding protein CcmA [Anaerolineae bacterium]
MILAERLGKRYGLRPVLRGVSLQVARGEFVAVLGANGAGKTTLLRILATLTRPDAGALWIGGVDALRHPERVRQQIGLVSHHSLVYGELTAAENLRFYGWLYGLRGDALERRIEEALRQMDLWSRRHDRARTFSRGMTQRLTIARALLHDPAVLLLDEPFTGLDQGAAATLSSLLREAALEGRAVIMTTHEIHRGLEGVTRALILRDGQIVHEQRDDLAPQLLAALLHDHANA